MGSFLAFSERLDVFARLSVACGVLLLFFILNIVVIPFPFIGALKAPFFLMAIYYWAIYRPTLVPLWLVFVAGCLMDLLGQTPFGFTALVLVLAQWFTSSQRRFLLAQPFIMIWLGFSVLYTASLFLKWGVVSVVEIQFLPLNNLWVMAFFGVTLFPPVCFLLHLTHKILPVPRQAIR